jgi:hypothetical protein
MSPSKIFVYSLISTIILFIGANLAFCEGDWTVHKDPLGFQVSHPNGWSVETPGKEFIEIKNQNGSAFVIIYPFITDQQITAMNYLNKTPSMFASQYPDARIQSFQRLLERPEEVVMAMNYLDDGVQGSAAILCVLDNRSGMLFAIAAPTLKFNATSTTLIRILKSFSFIKPESSQSQNVQYVVWKDPEKDAFSLDVPSGWNITGGLLEPNPGDLRLDVEIDSPDNKVGVIYGDTRIPLYISMSGKPDSLGLVDGTEYYPEYNLYLKAKQYMTGKEFAKAYADFVLKDIPGVVYNGDQDRQDLSQAINEVYRQSGLPLEANAGETTFTIEVNEERWQGYCLAVTEKRDLGSGSYLWQVSKLIGYIAPDSRELLARSILERTVSSFQYNSEWTQNQKAQNYQGQYPSTMVNQSVYPGTASQGQYPGVSSGQGPYTGSINPVPYPISPAYSSPYAGSSIDASSDVSNIITETYNNREKTMDDLSNKWSNTILGTTDLRDPNTGEVTSVESGSNYYWKDNHDTVWGTQTAESPSPSVDFTPLQEVTYSSSETTTES